jgi:uncharacterized protein YcaQ
LQVHSGCDFRLRRRSVSIRVRRRNVRECGNAGRQQQQAERETCRPTFHRFLEPPQIFVKGFACRNEDASGLALLRAAQSPRLCWIKSDDSPALISDSSAFIVSAGLTPRRREFCNAEERFGQERLLTSHRRQCESRLMLLNQTQARALLLAAQGLQRRPQKKATKADVLRVIRRMGALQIDTIHVVARSPYFVLWSRLGDYEPRWLEELLAEGALFEYWAHEACFLPVEEFQLYRHRMLDAESMGWKYSKPWVEEHRHEIEQLLRLIRERGAVRAADFARTDGKAGGWWEWKTEKRALEMLFTAGELMIARRQNFQRVYDLRERVLPKWDDRQLPTRDEVRRELTLKAVRALGITTARWTGDYFRTDRRETSAAVNALAEEGALITAQVEAWPEAAFIHPDNLKLAKAAVADALKPELTTLLSPFDPLVWDRARASAMFGFDYRIECYTPAPKRRYGYFTLPILWRDALVGRLDAKAHRKDGIFEIKRLHIEPGTRASAEMLDDIAAALRECAAWHRTPELIVRESDPPPVAARLQKLLKR